MSAEEKQLIDTINKNIHPLGARIAGEINGATARRIAELRKERDEARRLAEYWQKKAYKLSGDERMYPFDELPWKGEEMSALRNDPAFKLTGEYTKEELACMLLEARRLAEEWREGYLSVIGRGEDYRTGLSGDERLPWEVEKCG